MPYSIQFNRRAQRDFDVLDKPTQQRLRPHIDRLAADPFPAGAKKLRGDEPYYRIRVGDYRVVYQVEGRQLIVVVIKVGHRKEVYR